jgi:hypothetical protein
MHGASTLEGMGSSRLGPQPGRLTFCHARALSAHHHHAPRLLQGRNIDLAERTDDLALAHNMTVAFAPSSGAGLAGGAGATPAAKKAAAALAAKTPLSMLSASNFERRGDGGFRINSCAISRVRIAGRRGPYLPWPANEPVTIRSAQFAKPRSLSLHMFPFRCSPARCCWTPRPRAAAC